MNRRRYLHHPPATEAHPVMKDRMFDCRFCRGFYRNGKPRPGVARTFAKVVVREPGRRHRRLAGATHHCPNCGARVLEAQR